MGTCTTYNTPSLQPRAGPSRQQMSFVRYVEVGRVALITYGPDAGKLCTIVNVIDNNRALVDGAGITGVHRHAIILKRIQLTNIKIAAKLNASQKTLKSLWESEGVEGQWAETSQAKKRKARELRVKTTDFERFKVMLARKERSAARKAM